MAPFDLTRRPAPGDYADYQIAYLDAVPDGDVLAAMEREGRRTVRILRGIEAARAGHAYAPGKWTVRQVVAHLSDAERVFAYRALRFGRGDLTPLPAFDQDQYVPASHAETRPWSELVGELEAIRRASLMLFQSFAAEDWERAGEASGSRTTVRALAWVVVGHELHHRRILAERYGVG